METFEALFLRELYRREIDVYDLHKRYLLSPSQIAACVAKYLELGHIVVDGDLVRLTESGRQGVLARKGDVYFRGNQRTWVTGRQDKLRIRFFVEGDLLRSAPELSQPRLSQRDRVWAAATSQVKPS